MRKNVLLFGIIFLIFPYLVYSVTTFVIQETEKISLLPYVVDPDKDNVTIYFETPFDSNGTWQTTYGDYGTHDTKITASDGTSKTEQTIRIIVTKKEESPYFESASPDNEYIDIKEGESVAFDAKASDINKDDLKYKWFLEGKKQKEGKNYLFSTNYESSGVYHILIEVSDGTTSITKQWTINVADFDPQTLLDQIPDVVANENEAVKLQLSDFAEYGLAYTISSPIGNDNEWKTWYDDAGEYEVDVEAQGGGFKGSTEVNVIVNDVDRAPVFSKLENRYVAENERLTILLLATDEDEDDITYTADGLPEGASFNGNNFTWVPNNDAVRKKGIIDYIIDKFGTLTKNYYVQFTAESNEKKVVQNIIITVRDINRAPVMEDLAPITIKEGETFKITPKAYDLDYDSIKFHYSGFTNKNTYTSDYNDAGAYSVKVTASDGKDEVSKFVNITITETNGPAKFDKISSIKGTENEPISVTLNAKDPDNDAVFYYMDNAPSDSSIKGNVFTWTPDYDTTSKGQSRTFDIVFVATDGTSETRQVVKAEISDKNRYPFIVNATKGATVPVNEPVLMFVKAVDEDGDYLTYQWDFGAFEKYAATDTHERTYTTPGTKTVKVRVSDGLNYVDHIININVFDNRTITRVIRTETINNQVNNQITGTVVYRNTTRTNLAAASQQRQFDVEFFLRDVDFQTGTIRSTSQNIPNRAPVIVEAPRSITARVNEPASIRVRAVDPDGNRLSYYWDFGAFGDYVETANGNKVFTTPGRKYITLVVTDGKLKDEHVIEVNVV